MSYSNKYILAALPKTQRGQPIVLGSDPKGKNFLYTNGSSVIIRNIENPAISDVYTEHSTEVNVAKYSPSGFYIASADKSGKVRIWDTVNQEHILKNEFQPICGPIKDLAWSSDNQRMVVVGEGREKFGHVFMAETGTSVGEISGQSKSINSCDFRPSRPFRIVTASEDNTVAVFEGPPFKFKMTKQDHSRFVQVVRYSPSGDLFASAGFDGKMFLYDGTSSDLVGQVGSPAHSGGVYGLSWKPDGKQLLTASGDKTCKLWDVETKTCVTEFVIGDQLEDQQVACLWQGQYLLSVSLSGCISYLDVNNPSKPIRVIKGHNKSITALAISPDCKNIYTGSYDGVVTTWDADTGSNDRIGGIGHGNQINGMRATEASIYSCGIDDKLREISLVEKSYDNFEDKLGAYPKDMDLNKSTMVIATLKEILIYENKKKIFSLPVSFEPSCASISPDNSFVAVGGTADKSVHVFKWTGSALTALTELKHHDMVMDCAFSPDGNYLVACDAFRKVILYKVPDFQLAHNKQWVVHNARVNCVAWAPNSLLIASGSLDTTVIIWSVADPSKHILIKNAHPQSQVTKVAWLNDETLVSVGQDAITKIWNIKAN